VSAQYHLIGYPIAHSRSPAIQNAAFAAAGIDASYSLMPTPPEEFDSTIERLLDSEMAGANITAPFKERILSYVEPADELVARMGASNCLARVEGSWRAFNTDVGGFAQAAQRLLPDVEATEVAIVVLGAGGAARAVIGASARRGWAVTVVSRSLTDAQKLCEVGTTLGLQACAPAQVDMMAPDSSLQTLSHRRPIVMFVNATPLGLGGEHLPGPFSRLGIDVLVMDLLWVTTPLVQEHRARGGRALDGLPMVVEQAAEGWSIWTGRRAPRDVMQLAAVTDQY
jgi:shikimate dehydrogenase